RDVLEAKHLTCAKMPNIAARASPVRSVCCLQGRLADVHRQSELAMENSHAARVIAELGRDDQPGSLGDVPAMRGQPQLRLLTANSGIQQEPHPARLDIDAVAVASRLQWNHFHVPKLAPSVIKT